MSFTRHSLRISRIRTQASNFFQSGNVHYLPKRICLQWLPQYNIKELCYYFEIFKQCVEQICTYATFSKICNIHKMYGTFVTFVSYTADKIVLVLGGSSKSFQYLRRLFRHLKIFYNTQHFYGIIREVVHYKHKEVLQQLLYFKQQPTVVQQLSCTLRMPVVQVQVSEADTSCIGSHSAL